MPFRALAGGFTLEAPRAATWCEWPFCLRWAFLPSLTPYSALSLQVVTAFRPTLLTLVGQLVHRRESAHADSFAPGSATSLSHDEDCAAAFSKIAFLAPHTQPLVLRFFAVASHPLSRCPEPLSDPLAVRHLAFATLRLCETVGAPLERAWRGATAAAAARLVHSPDASTRWAAATLLERCLRLGAQPASSLRESLLSSSEARSRPFRTSPPASRGRLSPVL